MKNSHYLIIYILLISVCNANAEDVQLDKIPSEEFCELGRDYPDSFSELDISLEKRIELFNVAIIRAFSGSPIDNRTYFYALAIDLYNSIPPDVKPEPIIIDPQSDDEPDLFGRAPYKNQAYYGSLMRIDGYKHLKKKTLEEQKNSFDSYVRRRNPSDE